MLKYAQYFREERNVSLFAAISIVAPATVTYISYSVWGLSECLSSWPLIDAHCGHTVMVYNKLSCEFLVFQSVKYDERPHV